MKTIGTLAAAMILSTGTLDSGIYILNPQEAEFGKNYYWKLTKESSYRLNQKYEKEFTDSITIRLRVD